MAVRTTNRSLFCFRVALAVCLASLLSGGPSRAQTNGITYLRDPVFRIPFVPEPGAGRLQEVILYVSEDQGQSWRRVGSARPEERGVSFRAPHDGLYWFTAQTVDATGRSNPQTLQGAQPQLKVIVDTQVPSITLRQRAAREGGVAVEWDVREENLDPLGFNLEYRLPGATEWIPLPVEPSAHGEHTWMPGTNGMVEVRLRVRDLARNQDEARLLMTPGSQDFRTSSNLSDSTGRNPSAVRWVNSKRISFQYEIKEAGPSGTSVVELWCTRDLQTRTWQRVGEDRSHQPPMSYEVDGEGLYGFTLVVVSGVGLSAGPPRPGDPPQIWVSVDTTKPTVQLTGTEVGRGFDKGKLTISWHAEDKNLRDRPITLAYSEKLDGAWETIVADADNSGRYIWTMPANVPYQFFIRVQATDKAANVGAAQTPTPVKVDLAQPKGIILDVAPASGERGHDGISQ
jgi:hypothetical protein